MRDIKFRGLRVENEYHKNDKWKVGNLLNDCSIGSVGQGLLSYEYAEVIPETVGQYTGLKDKNGKEIYESDILYITGHYIGDFFNPDHNGTVKFDDGSFGVYCDASEYGSYDFELDSTTIHNYDIEIIGNIHENPELL